MDLQDPQTWEAFIAGYEAGISHGIEMGRAQVEAEDHQVWARFAANVRALGRQPGPSDHQERQAWLRDRQERAARRPSLSGPELIAAARQSWAQPPRATRRPEPPHERSF